MFIKQLAHVCIGALDLAETERFYREVLGLSKQFEFKKNGAVIGFYLDTGANTFIEVFAKDALDHADRPVIDHLCLEVTDLDALIAHVEGQGWPISEKSMGSDHTWQAWITDPSGVRIELQQYTPDSSQRTGRDCLVDW